MTTKKTIRNFLRKRFPKENAIINKGKSAGIPGGIFIQLKKAGLFSNGGEMLKNPKKADLDKDGKLSSYEKRRGMAIEKKNFLIIHSMPERLGMMKIEQILEIQKK